MHYGEFRSKHRTHIQRLKFWHANINWNQYDLMVFAIFVRRDPRMAGYRIPGLSPARMHGIPQGRASGLALFAETLAQADLS